MSPRRVSAAADAANPERIAEPVETVVFGVAAAWELVVLRSGPAARHARVVLQEREVGLEAAPTGDVGERGREERGASRAPRVLEAGAPLSLGDGGGDLRASSPRSPAPNCTFLAQLRLALAQIQAEAVISVILNWSARLKKISLTDCTGFPLDLRQVVAETM